MDTKKLRDYAKTVKSDKGKDTLDKSLIAKVTGVSFDGRQEFLALMHPGTEIRLERDRRNEFDFYAVKVMAKIESKWEHVGFIPAKMSKKIAFSLDNGVNLFSKVHRIVGGQTTASGDKLSYGLEITVLPEM